MSPYDIIHAETVQAIRKLEARIQELKFKAATDPERAPEIRRALTQAREALRKAQQITRSMRRNTCE